MASRDRAPGARQSEVTKQVDHRLQPLCAIGVDVHAGIIEKACARAQPDPAFVHIAGNDVRRPIALAAERAFEIPARVVQDVAATPVDEFEQAEHGVAEAEAVADRLVDLLRTGDAFLDHACGLVHRQRLDARNDEARRRRADDRHLADAFEQSFDFVDNGGIGGFAGRNLDQRDQIGRVEPVHVEKAAGIHDRAG